MEHHENEKTPLLIDTVEAMREAYGTSTVAKFVLGTDNVTDYAPKKLSSFRVCCVRRGTVLRNPVLFVEQFLLTCVFVGFASASYYFTTALLIKKKMKNMEEDMMHDLTSPPVDATMDTGMTEFLLSAMYHPETMSHWIQKQEAKMRAFCIILTSLSSFLMALYTSTNVNRWWNIRTQGIGGIKAATLDLQWTVCQCVTRDNDILSAIRRYGQASLKLFFLWRGDAEKGQLTDSIKEQLMEDDVLTKDEVALLKGLTHCLHETIWAWQVGIVMMLRRDGLIKSESVYQLLLDNCEKGRQAMQCIHTHLAVRIPMQYIHLLGFVVKTHNIILAVIMGVLFGVTARQRQFLICCQLFGRTLILPFLFNAILIMNAELSDPFDGNGTDDFSASILLNGLDKDCRGFVKATQNVPHWIAVRAKAAEGA